VRAAEEQDSFFFEEKKNKMLTRDVALLPLLLAPGGP
jgi:hypothetical protein